jgi:hypothetical protein
MYADRLMEDDWIQVHLEASFLKFHFSVHSGQHVRLFDSYDVVNDDSYCIFLPLSILFNSR